MQLRTSALTLSHSFLLRSWKALWVISAGAVPIVMEEVSWAALFKTLKRFSYGGTAPTGLYGNYQDDTFPWKGVNQLPVLAWLPKHIPEH